MSKGKSKQIKTKIEKKVEAPTPVIPEIKQINGEISKWLGILETAASLVAHSPSRTAIYESLQPKDPIEAMLISQISSVHELTMIATARAMKMTFNPEHLMHATSKLSQTFMRLVESLNAYRGKQTTQHIRVEQVKIESGAQAIVGNVNTRGGSNDFSKPI
jgi:hypothetical protein